MNHNVVWTENAESSSYLYKPSNTLKYSIYGATKWKGGYINEMCPIFTCLSANLIHCYRLCKYVHHISVLFHPSVFSITSKGGLTASAYWHHYMIHFNRAHAVASWSLPLQPHYLLHWRYETWDIHQKFNTNTRWSLIFLSLYELLISSFTCITFFPKLNINKELLRNLTNQQAKSYPAYLLRLLFVTVEDDGLLCQFLFLWLMNQLLICFSCKPVSCTNLALSSSWKNMTTKWA